MHTSPVPWLPHAHHLIKRLADDAGLAYAPDGGRIEIQIQPDGGTVTNTYAATGELIRQQGVRTYPVVHD